LKDAPKDTGNRNLFGSFRHSLQKTRASFSGMLGNLLLGEREISEQSMDRIEEILLLADIGPTMTQRIIDRLGIRVKRRELDNMNALLTALRDYLIEILAPAERELVIDPRKAPFVILFAGVNGSGKTTTIGKLGKRLQTQGHRVLLAAGDTFRAAAIEQLQILGGRLGIPVIARQRGADSASVMYDALQAARAQRHDVVLIDTAGRLQNKSHLMAELAKSIRILRKFGNDAPHETLLVMDAGTGQNGLKQAAQYQDVIKASGLIVTKLDGTAKGGIIIAANAATGLPILFAGTGEADHQLEVFRGRPFVEALLTTPTESGTRSR